MRTKAAPKTASKGSRRAPFHFESLEIPAGTRQSIELPVARVPAGTWATMPTEIVHGAAEGPTIWLSGAIHGDELNGVEIIRRTLLALNPRQLAGTVIAVPIVNIFGVTIESRYLPDRRDLNRSFPGSLRGSLASRQAHIFFDRVVRRCELGIDFHTGSAGRYNLPQLRCDLDDPQTRRCAEAFAAPVAIHSTLRDGSLRAAARPEGIRVLVFEGGEASRFDEGAIQAGMDGTLRVLAQLQMIEAPPPPPLEPAQLSRKSSWMRAGRSGFCQLSVEVGARVEKGASLATVSGSLGRDTLAVRAKAPGIVVGVSRAAQVHRGDAVVHVAEVDA